jgi:S-disulfanyl-L-cysteine oxidoreductase SoxD
VGHQHPARWHRAAAGERHARPGCGRVHPKCQSCHGEKGAGKPNDQLVGGQGTLTSASPVRTIGSYWPYATTVFDYVRRAMPYTQTHSLTNEEVYAVTAYLLHLNGIIGAQDVMNAHTLPQVKMPNRDNFMVVYPTKPK